MGQGFTLVEALVSLAVLAIGVLGVATMLLAALRESQDALLQTQAAILGADLGERIRANRLARSSYQLEEGAILAPPAVDCRATGACEPADLAGLDLYEWQQSALAALPDARTSVRVTGAAGLEARHYTITVWWAARGTDVSNRLQLTVLA